MQVKTKRFFMAKTTSLRTPIRGWARSTPPLSSPSEVHTGERGQKGQLRAVQGSSKIIPALTFPKLAQLWTGQVRAARAGFWKSGRLTKTRGATPTGSDIPQGLSIVPKTAYRHSSAGGNPGGWRGTSLLCEPTLERPWTSLTPRSLTAQLLI